MVALALPNVERRASDLRVWLSSSTRPYVATGDLSVRRSYYDERAEARRVWWAVVVAVLIISALGVATIREYRTCLVRGGWYSFRAGICFSTSAVVRP